MAEKEVRTARYTLGIRNKEIMATPKIGRRSISEQTTGLEVLTSQLDSLPEPVLTPQAKAEEAALYLLSFLPKDAMAVIEDAAHGLNIPVWQAMMGFLMRCYDQMLLQASVYSPYILGNWDQAVAAGSPRECEACHQMFEAGQHDARFCCSRCYFGKVAAQGHDPACPTRKATV